VVKENDIARLYVDPRHQRRGIGRALFEVLENAIRKNGFGYLTPSVVPFYQKTGTDAVGRKPSPYPLGKEAILMGKDPKA